MMHLQRNDQKKVSSIFMLHRIYRFDDNKTFDSKSDSLILSSLAANGSALVARENSFSAGGLLTALDSCSALFLHNAFKPNQFKPRLKIHFNYRNASHLVTIEIGEFSSDGFFQVSNKCLLAIFFLSAQCGLIAQ